MCHFLQFDAYCSCYNNKASSNICLAIRPVIQVRWRKSAMLIAMCYSSVASFSPWAWLVSAAPDHSRGRLPTVNVSLLFSGAAVVLLHIVQGFGLRIMISAAISELKSSGVQFIAASAQFLCAQFKPQAAVLLYNKEEKTHQSSRTSLETWRE